MKSLKVTRDCPQCGKVAETTDECRIGADRILFYVCGHQEYITGVDAAEDSAYQITSRDDKTLYPFQLAGVKFGEEADGRWLCADAMGLGKTVQIMAFLKLHLDEVRPILIVCKSALLVQFFQEAVRWIGHRNGDGKWVADVIPQIIRTSREKPLLDTFDVFIVSFDLLRRCKWVKDENYVFKTLIIDECQQVKSPDAARTQAVRRLAKRAKHVIALSGTPFKNRLMEYFPILNMIRPDKFPVMTHMLHKYAEYWVDRFTGQTKIGGLRNIERWKADTGDFIIRREREQVLPDLPTLDRRFQWMDLATEVQKAYGEAYDEFCDAYDGSGAHESQTAAERQTNILGYMSRMRHLTGISKVGPCIDFVKDFLETTDRKITVFVHHKDVAQILFDSLKAYTEEKKQSKPLMFHSSLDADQRMGVIEAFKEKENRILIASSLAAGEGINLQFCSDMIQLERQWNPANEEQSECRFIRI